MRLLLTSGGLRTQSMKDALVGLLDKPVSESRFVFVPTAANPEGGHKDWLIHDINSSFEMGWKNYDIVDLAAVSSMPRDRWWPRFDQADVLMFGGGTTFYLSYWLEKSGLMKALPEMLKTKVYVGISAGSMVAGDSLRVASEALEKFGELKDDEYDELGPRGQSSSKTLQLARLVVRPHFNSPEFPNMREDFLQQVAKSLSVPMYAIDDQTAIKVVDGKVEVISEGMWKVF
ncbi:MAG TPA: Type 1 glutamine amidotransferase-like domain-containing protein [Candidatus Saccharimonadales bacterium]|nr:Type 1 glutamine amidotransferase-like domain-containing protein [Candidatus Saccharimonadales bacterium]